ncbi:hypothetical protein ABIE65_005262 [Constrictibacter sp. MBR-5]|jgi:hypothetical protein|uniref:hypothetical protein n=1 Tax=Constrictibacter sp. MBR-5 TaxID=3156467 RepID=UPI00339347B3
MNDLVTLDVHGENQESRHYEWQRCRPYIHPELEFLRKAILDALPEMHENRVRQRLRDPICQLAHQHCCLGFIATETDGQWTLQPVGALREPLKRGRDYWDVAS